MSQKDGLPVGLGTPCERVSSNNEWTRDGMGEGVWAKRGMVLCF